MNIAIIGAGPIGCYTGYLLAKCGHDVSIYENHAQVGAPVQCTGILTSEFDKFGIPVDSFLVNTINKITVHSPSQEVSINQKNYVVCRYKFDNFLANLAVAAGAKIFVNHSFQRKEGPDLIIKELSGSSTVEKIKRINPEIVIAADGPLSPTAKAYGLYDSQREHYFGMQAIVTGKFEPKTVKTYFGNDLCPELFAWIVPESATSARVGLAAQSNTKYYFDKFMRKHGFIAKEVQGGVIPLYNPRQRLKKDNCYLVGDASTYVKATTLGGIIPTMHQAKILTGCINNGKDYENEVSPIRRQMWLHLQVHNIFSKFTNNDWDRLLSYVKQEKIRTILQEYTRDNPLPLLTRALLKEPRLLYFMKFLW